jgi:predicted amidohydrolase
MTRRNNEPSRIKVAAIQMAPELGAVEANRTRVLDLLHQAATEGAQLVVLPECATTGPTFMAFCKPTRLLLRLSIPPRKPLFARNREALDRPRVP